MVKVTNPRKITNYFTTVLIAQDTHRDIGCPILFTDLYAMDTEALQDLMQTIKTVKMLHKKRVVQGEEYTEKENALITKYEAKYKTKAIPAPCP